MATLREEIVAYEAMQADLESAHLGEWALVHERKLIGTFKSFDLAAREAVHRFGRGPYLIRQIGAAALTLPASVMCNPVQGKGSVRVQS
jgi:hypothetical protein